MDVMEFLSIGEAAGPDPRRVLVEVIEGRIGLNAGRHSI